MIKANELRIGNWVTGGVDLPTPMETFQVTDINPHFDLTDLIEPIPLTEEWLLKFGFEKQKVRMGGKEYEGWVNFSFHLDTNHAENTLFYHWMGGNIEIKSLHQLQNLYFALTGKELTTI